MASSSISAASRVGGGRVGLDFHGVLDVGLVILSGMSASDCRGACKVRTSRSAKASCGGIIH